MGNIGAVVALKGCIQDAAEISAAHAAGVRVDAAGSVVSKRLEGMQGVLDLTLRELGKLEDRKQRLERQTENLDNLFVQSADRITRKAMEYEQAIGQLEGLSPELLSGLTEWVGADGKEVIDQLRSAVENVRALEQLETGTLPVGSIIGWHETPETVSVPKDLVGPGKPWMRCNGDLVTDVDSPFNGDRLPNLNGEGRFLRGGTKSGTMQEDKLRSHSHQYNTPSRYDESAPGTGRTARNPTTGTTEPVGGEETRPINMSVVWIIRVK